MSSTPILTFATIQPHLAMCDFAHNVRETIELYRAAVAAGADVVVGPELGITDYPALDLYLRADVRAGQDRAFAELRAAIGDVPYVTSVVARNLKGRGKPLVNLGVVVQHGENVYRQPKTCLADMFEYQEWRHFEPNPDPVRPFTLTLRDGNEYRFGLLICEDVWSEGEQGGSGVVHHRVPVDELAAAGDVLDAVVVVNGSAYWYGKRRVRRERLAHVARTLRAPIAYANKVGGQDELVFDGGSLIVDADGVVVAAGPHCAPGIAVSGRTEVEYDEADDPGCLYDALVCGVRDYATKNGFRSAILGLSGGIDSALTLAIAVDALGAEHVRAIMMPSPYTSRESLEDAADCAQRLGVPYEVLPIVPGMEAFQAMLAPVFEGTTADVTEENIQARIRGTMLMALSNKFGALLLSTGNKSEMAVGYATLYGDMAGGFAVLKDVWKTDVFTLARYRNERGLVIPERIITKPPSAELRADQKDTDSLPPYEVLDRILRSYVEEYADPAAIVRAGHDPELVARVVRMVDRAEYKRRQAPPGPKVTTRGLAPEGGRIVPITVNLRAP